MASQAWRCSDLSGSGQIQEAAGHRSRVPPKGKGQGYEQGKDRDSAGCREILWGHGQDGLEAGRSWCNKYVPQMFIECARNITGDTVVTKTVDLLPSGCLPAVGVGTDNKHR